MWMLLAIVGLLVLFRLLWRPAEETVNAPDEAPVPARTAHRLSQPALSLIVDETGYGATFKGFKDTYCFSTSCPAEQIDQSVHMFFSARKAKLLTASGGRMVFSRGRKIFNYFGAFLDTQPSQEIDVWSEPTNGLPAIWIRYKVAGWHIRTPPNQLRGEVLKLQSQLN